MNNFKSSLKLCSKYPIYLIISVLFCQNMHAGTVIIINKDSGKEDFLVRKSTEHERRFRTLKFNSMCVLKNIDFQNSEGVKIKGSSWSGASFVIEKDKFVDMLTERKKKQPLTKLEEQQIKEQKFENILIVVNSSSSRFFGGGDLKFDFIPVGKEFARFIDKVEELEKIADLSDEEITSIGAEAFEKISNKSEEEQDSIKDTNLFKIGERIGRYKKYFNDYVKFYLEEFYKDLIIKLDAVEKKLENAINIVAKKLETLNEDKEFDSLKMSMLVVEKKTGTKTVSKRDTVNHSKFVDKIFGYYEQGKGFEVKLASKLGAKKIEMIEEISGFVKKRIKKEEYVGDSVKNDIVKKIFLLSTFLVHSKEGDRTEEEKNALVKDLIEKIEEISSLLNLKLKKVIFYGDAEKINKLDLKAIKDNLKNIKEFNVEFAEIVKDCDILTFLYADLTQKVAEIEKKLNAVKYEKYLEFFSGFAKDDKDLFFKQINLYVEDKKIDLNQDLQKKDLNFIKKFQDFCNQGVLIKEQSFDHRMQKIMKIVLSICPSLIKKKTLGDKVSLVKKQENKKQEKSKKYDPEAYEQYGEEL